MTNNISIINTTNNDLHLDVAVDGVDVGDMVVRFVIDMGDVCHTYQCKQGSEAARWDVHIPSPSYIPMGEYTFRVEIVTNGYFFAPYSGTIHVSTTPIVTDVAPLIAKTKNIKPKRDVVLERRSTKSKAKPTPIKRAPSKQKEQTPKSGGGLDKMYDVVKLIIDDTTTSSMSHSKKKNTPTVRPIQLPAKTAHQSKKHHTPNLRKPPTVSKTQPNSHLTQVLEKLGEPDPQVTLVRNILDGVETTK